MEPIMDREPHTMLTALDDILGNDVASILMRHLPPGGWGAVATKHDLIQLEDRITHRVDAMLTRQIGDLRTELHTELGGLRTELHTELGSLRSEMHTELGDLRTELRSEIGSLRSDMHGEIGILRRELHTEIGTVRSDMQAMTRTYILGNVGLVFTVAAIAFGAARLV